ncbi:MAG: universal stress protein, partial [Gammaproteobacteria bacterium]|nr:universal stress protein [Gammaproteobacteria bacterium]
PGLLVMGAYEHSKFRQSIVGGVTSSVLKKAKIPIIISH